MADLPTPQEEIEAFANLIFGILTEHNWSNSDLAGKLWGYHKDKKGYSVARNRDRIGRYLLAQGWPDNRTAAKLARITGLPASRFRPLRRKPERATPPRNAYASLIETSPSSGLLQIQQVVPLSVGRRVLSLLAEVDGDGQKTKTDSCPA